MAVKLNVKMAPAAIFDFLQSEIWCQRKSRPTRIYLHTKFGTDTSKGGRVMAIYVFSKWWLAAILNCVGSKFWRQNSLRNIAFSPVQNFVQMEAIAAEI